MNMISVKWLLPSVSALVLILLGIASPCAPTMAAPRRIYLPHGRGTRLVRGRLNGFQSVADFVLHAHRGQRLDLSATGGVVMVYFPRGGQDGAPGGVNNIFLPQTGTYRIEVSEHRMGEPWRGSFTLKVRLH